MWFRLSNQNVKYSYPLIERCLNIHEKFYRETGFSDYVVELQSIDDLITLGACAEASDEYYDGMLINGNTITILSEVKKNELY